MGANEIAEDLNLPAGLRILLSLGAGYAVSKVAGKYILTNSEGKVIGEYEGESKTKFTYNNNPMDNPKVPQDAIENPDAVYGFSSNPESKRIGDFASDDYDWTNPSEVEKYKNIREKYHIENDNIPNMVNKMKSEGASEEEIGRVAVNLRNQNRLNSYLNRGDIAGYERVLKSNMDTYSNSLGITPEMALQKYGSWEVVIEKTTSANPGMDACCGLYDKYYHIYGN